MSISLEHIVILLNLARGKFNFRLTGVGLQVDLGNREKMDYLDYFNDDESALPRPDRRAIIDRSNPVNDFDEINFHVHFVCASKMQLT